MDLTATPGLAIAAIVGLGAAAQWLAWRVNLPAILPLLITGFLLGPGLGLVQPLELFGADLLFPSVSLAVGLILFEGGMTLKLSELRDIRGTVWRLVSLGALVTWLVATAAGYFIAGLDLLLAFLFGALIIVTGPTVIGPLLRIVRPVPKVGNVLKWEGILIDPIGAMVAVLVFEFIVHAGRGDVIGTTLLLFGRFILVGSIVGAVGGLIMASLLKGRRIPDFLVNLIALALVFGAFAVANTFADEAGLLATTLMGIIIANTAIPNRHNILNFKEDLTVLFISILFIVLAANIEFDTLMQVTSFSSLLLLAVIMLVARPLNVFISTVRSDFSIKEKLYLSWIAPRGIVAAAVSSLFASRLVSEGFANAETLAPLVFLIIVGTVLLNSLTARPLAQYLGIAEPDPQGFLILGAHAFARRIARFLAGQGVKVLLADTNGMNVAMARSEGLAAYHGNLLSDQADDELRLAGIGKLLALTSNDEANALTALKYAREFDTQNVYQLEPSRSGSSRGSLGDSERGRTLFQQGVTYDQLKQLFDRGASFETMPVAKAIKPSDEFLPMFIVNDRSVRVLSTGESLPSTGGTLVALTLKAKGKAKQPVSLPS